MVELGAFGRRKIKSRWSRCGFNSHALGIHLKKKLSSTKHFAVRRLDDRGRWMRADQTRVISLQDSNVAILAPRRTPRVFDDPIRRVVCIVIADNQNSVIDLVLATAVRHNAAFIHVPLVAINPNSKRAFCEHEIRHRSLVARNVHVSHYRCTKDAVVGHRSASRGISVVGCVGITLKREDLPGSVVKQPMKCRVDASAIAAFLRLVTRKQFFGGQVHEFVPSNFPLAFDAACRSKAPVTGALPL